MAKIGGIARASVIPQIKRAITAGKSASSFIREMRDKGLSYRRTDMLADWRNVGNIEKKTGLLRYVRKDRIPSPSIIAAVNWKLSREFMYKVRVQSRLKPGEPLTERFVNIVNDKPMTPGEVERQIYLSWGGWYAESRDQVVAVIPELAVRRVSG